MQESDKKYTYQDAGFNRFFSRSILGQTAATTLSGMSSSAPQQSINFDQMAISGSLGDVLKVGRVYIDGRNGRIDIQSESGDVIGRFGEEG